MASLRELWRLYPDRSNIQRFADVWARRPAVGAVAPVASSVISGELPLETTVLRLRLPLPLEVTARSIFVDVSGRRWFPNEVAQVGRRFYDVSVSTYVPTVTLGDEDTDLAGLQRGYTVGFHPVAPDGTELRPASVPVESWSFADPLPGVEDSRPDAGNWFSRFGLRGPGVVVPSDPVLGVVKASGEIVQPFWVELPDELDGGQTLYRVWLRWVDASGGLLHGSSDDALLELPPLESQYPDGAAGLSLVIIYRDQPGAERSIPPSTDASVSSIAGTSFRVLRESEIPGG